MTAAEISASPAAPGWKRDFGAPALALAFIIAYVYLFYGERLDGWWNINNDHKIMIFLHPQGKLAWGELLQKFQGVYYTVPGGPMYRPVYEMYNMSQAFLWGDNAFAHILFRLSMFVLVVYLWWASLRPFVGGPMAMLVTMALAGHPHFAEMLGDAGPCEFSGMIGFSIALYAGSRIIREPAGYGRVWLSVLYFGFLTAIGAKENYMLLFPLILFVYYYPGFAIRKDRAARVFIAATIALGLYFTIAVSYGILISGRDIYGGGDPFPARVKGLLEGLFHGRDMIFKLPIYTSLAAYFLMKPALSRAGLLTPRVGRVFAVMNGFNKTGMVLLLVWLSQQFYYNNTLPTGMRYDFPGRQAVDLLYIAAIYAFVEAMAILLAPARAGGLDTQDTAAPQAGRIKTLAVAALAVLFFIATSGISREREILIQTRRYTVDSSHFKRTLFTMLEKSAGRQLVMVTRYPNLDYESFFSLGMYLRKFRFTGQIFIVVDLYPMSSKADTPLNKLLMDSLMEMTFDGWKMFQPFYMFDEAKGYDVALTQRRFTNKCLYCPGAGTVYNLHPDSEIILTP